MLKRSYRQQPAILTRKRKSDVTNENTSVDICQPPESPEFSVHELDSSVDEAAGTPEMRHTVEPESITAMTVDEPHPEPARLLTGPGRHNSYKWFRHVPYPSTRRIDTPMPFIRWANAPDVWDNMIEKDDQFQQRKNPDYLSRHPEIQSRMRAIVLDWLVEVCEVYRLQRATFFLAVDFFDRYFTNTSNVEKQYLQLVGITCLFLAAKYEEIYPPKLMEFSYVTDGAFSKEDILDQEIILLRVLDWDVSTITITDWLHTYLQLANRDTAVAAVDGNRDNLLVPNYSAHLFYQITQIVDLAMLDIGCLQFAHRTIAASALNYLSSFEAVKSVTGFEWHELRHCIDWMTPFVATLFENGFGDMKFFPEVPDDEAHNIQVHLQDLQLYDKAIERKIQFSGSSCETPDILAGFLTPPNSNEKPITDVDNT